jgi:hypothetical protein
MKLTLFGAIGVWLIVLLLATMMLAECVHPAQTRERREFRKTMEHNFPRSE